MLDKLLQRCGDVGITVLGLTGLVVPIFQIGYFFLFFWLLWNHTPQLPWENLLCVKVHRKTDGQIWILFCIEQ